jgi:hypothetical protein
MRAGVHYQLSALQTCPEPANSLTVLNQKENATSGSLQYRVSSLKQYPGMPTQAGFAIIAIVQSVVRYVLPARVDMVSSLEQHNVHSL